VDNVMVGVIRCSTREYRAYAYGINGKFEATGERPWRPIDYPTGGFAYQLAMSEDYACQYSHSSFAKKEIIKRMRWQGVEHKDFSGKPN
jgi:hypothetical protein